MSHVGMHVTCRHACHMCAEYGCTVVPKTGTSTGGVRGSLQLHSFVVGLGYTTVN